MSFNENLRDEGIITILNHIPKTTFVIAFVECGISDKAGNAIIKCANNASNLNGIYIEGNNFSKKREIEFEKLRINNPDLIVLNE